MKIFEKLLGKKETPKEIREGIIETHIAEYIATMVSNSYNIKEVTGLDGKWIIIDGEDYFFAEPAPENKDQANFCRQYGVKINIMDVKAFCQKKCLDLRFMNDNRKVVNDDKEVRYYLVKA